LIKQVDISELKPNNLNSGIYGDESQEDDQFQELLASIKKNGVLRPPVIDESGIIYAGKRRIDCCRILGIKNLAVDIRSFKTEIERITFLIEENRSREKTTYQKINEGIALEAAISADLEARQKHKDLSKEDIEKSVLRGLEKVTGRDFIGHKIGMSGKTFDNGKTVVKTIKDLEGSGKTKQANELKRKLNKTVHGAKSDADKINGKVPQEKEAPPGFWYLDDLKKLSSMMRDASAKMGRKTTNTTPTALRWFISNIITAAERMESWLPENMSQCQNCGGAGRLSDGSTCQNCINGMVGIYKQPKPSLIIETAESIDPAITEEDIPGPPPETE
jgi:hypothetical protein